MNQRPIPTCGKRRKITLAAALASLPLGRFIAAIAITAAVSVSLAAPAAQPQRDNFDKRLAAQASTQATGAAIATVASRAAAQAKSQLEARVKHVRVDADPILHTPKFVASHDGFLTGPKGEGAAVSTSAASAVPANDRHRGVKAFLTEYRGLFGFGPETLDRETIFREEVTPHSGLRTVVWRQHLDGLPVFESQVKASLTAKGELVNIGSTFVPDPAAAANHGMQNRATQQASPRISAVAAVRAAAANVAVELAADDIKSRGAAKGLEKRERFDVPEKLNGAEVSLVWLPMDAATMRLCWRVVFVVRATGWMYQTVVDAETGEVLVRHSLTENIQDATYSVFTGESPTPMSPDLATPSTAQPSLVNRQLVTLSALDTTASPNGWINDGENTTIGNNVNAHLDTDNDGYPDPGSSPVGSPFRVFDFALDLAQEPAAYHSASTVQLFYWCNFAHDKLYALGFTEAAGNFQTDNFGRGGVGDDPVWAQNEDSSVDNISDPTDGVQFNNANFSTPPDSESATFYPTMQMYLFNGVSPALNGSLDAEVVLHEYVHGLSNRLVGGGVGISALQTRGMGEGWSDFYALTLLRTAGEDVNANYAAGAYATRGFLGVENYANYYYGIRRYPYTTNMSRNPLTFAAIDPDQISLPPANVVPINPVFADSDADEVHAMGEVWCTILWEARANFVTKLGFEQGNQKILQIVTDAMKLSPANPNFVQARDAIYQAELALTAGANRPELENAFAKRGLGLDATSSASDFPPQVFESRRESVLPTVAITSPANTSTITAISSITGTAGDAGSGIASNGVLVYIRRNSDDHYWNGSGWVTDAQGANLPTSYDATTAQWICSPGSSGATFPAPGSTLLPGSYNFIAIAVDRAGNNKQADSVVTVAQAAMADLVTTVTDSPDPVSNGADVTYWVTVRNNGPDKAHQVTVFAGAENANFKSSNVSPDQIDSQMGYVFVGPLDISPNTATSFSLTFTAVKPAASQPQVINFWADAVGSEDDPTPDNASAVVVTHFSALSGCSIEFTDVPSTHPYHAAIHCLACQSVMNGFSDNTFRPDNNVTRAQLAKIVAIAAAYDYTPPPTAQTFADVDSSNPFYLPIEQLAYEGVISGYACSGVNEPCDSQNRPYFRPSNNITRGQIAKVVALAARLSGTPTGQTFADVPSTDALYPYVELLAAQHMISGYSCGGPGEPCDSQTRPYYRPFNNMTRGGTAQLISLAFYPNCGATSDPGPLPGPSTPPVCPAGFADCDGNPVNGCEVNLKTNQRNCGACGISCPDGYHCENGTCVPDGYPISASILPIGSGTVSGARVYTKDATVTLTARPSAGFSFVNWTENGTAVSTSATYSFKATTSRTLVAHFAPIKYTINVSASPAAGGTVSGAGAYGSGVAVTVKAVPNTAYKFLNWLQNGAPVSGTATYHFTATANRDLIAKFIAKPIITVSAPDPDVTEGASAIYKIKATPNTFRPVTVALTMSGTAKRGEDYTLSVKDKLFTANAVTFKAGVDEGSIKLTALHDKIAERGEGATLTLNNGTDYLLKKQNGAVVQNSARIAILDPR